MNFERTGNRCIRTGINSSLCSGRAKNSSELFLLKTHKYNFWLYIYVNKTEQNVRELSKSRWLLIFVSTVIYIKLRIEMFEIIVGQHAKQRTNIAFQKLYTFLVKDEKCSA